MATSVIVPAAKGEKVIAELFDEVTRTGPLLIVTLTGKPEVDCGMARVKGVPFVTDVTAGNAPMVCGMGVIEIVFEKFVPEIEADNVVVPVPRNVTTGV